MDNERRLTTTDNPFNPFNQFEEWYEFDVRQGHNTLALLGRMVQSSNELSMLDDDEATDLAITEIIDANYSGIHTTVIGPKRVKTFPVS